MYKIEYEVEFWEKWSGESGKNQKMVVYIGSDCMWDITSLEYHFSKSPEFRDVNTWGEIRIINITKIA
jgi:hypothetical protein